MDRPCVNQRLLCVPFSRNFREFLLFVIPMRFLWPSILWLSCFAVTYGQALIEWGDAIPTSAKTGDGLSFTILGPPGSTATVELSSSLANTDAVTDRAAVGSDSIASTWEGELDGGTSTLVLNGIVLSRPGRHIITAKITDSIYNITHTLDVYPSEITIGGSFDREWEPGAVVEIVVTLAVELINDDPDLLPDTTLKMVSVGSNCRPSDGVRTALQLLSVDKALSIIGPSCSSVAQPVALVAETYEAPIIGFDASHPALSNKAVFPYFVRVVAPSYYEALSLMAFAKQMGWESVAIIMLDNYAMSDEVFSVADKMGMKISSTLTLKAGGSVDEFETRLASIKKAGAKVIISNVLNADGVTLAAAAARAGIVGPGYTWLFEGAAGEYVLNDLDDELSAPFNGSFTLVPGDTIGDKVLRQKVVDLWNTKDPATYIPDNPFPEHVPEAHEDDPNEQNTLYGDLSRTLDAAYVVARALHKVFYENPSPTGFSGELLRDAMLNIDFFGASGQVSFDNNGDFHVPWAIRNFQFGSSTGSLSRRSLTRNTVEVKKIIPLDDFKFEMEQVLPTEAIWFSTGLGSVPPAFTCDRGCDHGTCVAHDTCVCDEDWVDDAATGRDCSIPIVESTVQPSSGVGIVIMILLALLICILGASLAGLYIYRDESSIRAISPFFSSLIVVGLILICAGAYAYVGRPTVARCVIQAWFISIGYSLAMGALFTKTWRLMKIFGNNKLQVMPLTDKRILLWTLGAVFITIILLVIWTTVELPHPKRIDTDLVYSYQCVSDRDGGVFSAILAYTGSLMLLNTIVAYRTRNITTSHNESRFIGLAVYNIAIFSAIVIAVVYGIPNITYMFKFLITTLACIISILISWAVLIGRPLFIVWKSLHGNSGEANFGADMLRTSVKPGSKRQDVSNEVMTSTTLPVEDQAKWVKVWKKCILSFVKEPIGAVLLREDGKESGLYAEQAEVSGRVLEDSKEYTDCFELRIGKQMFICQAGSKEECVKWADILNVGSGGVDHGKKGFRRKTISGNNDNRVNILRSSMMPSGGRTQEEAPGDPVMGP
ncbi:periplasmic binding protein-like I [Gaertneriomyces semiglobifer]|nr:periplasmic binding protein-like I [Gaertneriomyces semiglobifer]